MLYGVGIMLIIFIAGVTGYLLGVQSASVSPQPQSYHPSFSQYMRPPVIQPTRSRSGGVFSCSNDTQCISVRADSCGCTQGGRATAINKGYSSSWGNGFQKQMCTQMMSKDWTCVNAIPKCINNVCQLVKMGN